MDERTNDRIDRQTKETGNRQRDASTPLDLFMDVLILTSYCTLYAKQIDAAYDRMQLQFRTSAILSTMQQSIQLQATLTDLDNLEQGVPIAQKEFELVACMIVNIRILKKHILVSM